MHKPVSITAVASVSPLGTTDDEIWNSCLLNRHCFTEKNFGRFHALVAELTAKGANEIAQLRNSDIKYRNLDNSVLYAMYAARKAVEKAGWEKNGKFGINIGSSRGATGLFERYYDDFLQRGKAETLASPTTTLGNISSWIAHDLQSNGPEISHSITCSTALHAVLNGVAWINSGMTDRFLVGGSEAPLTPFTIAQMKALKIYSERNEEQYPCEAFNLDKKRNSMILGEGAAVLCMEKGIVPDALALIEGIGYATEILEHNISISKEADCFQKSMKMALQNTDPKEVDAVVMHAPGTIKGDLSEVSAINAVFGERMPALTTNKWKIGHTFGASGALNLELAIKMMQHQKFIEVPFAGDSQFEGKIEKVMVNAVGFGGNAVSILLKLPVKL